MVKKYNSQSGKAQAHRLFEQAQQTLPAYKQFLAENQATTTDFASAPYIDKLNYITRHPLAAMCWQGSMAGLDYVVSSSGSTGRPFYWPRGKVQDDVSARLYGSVFEESFGLDEQPTLLINSYGQGTWIAGTELYNTGRILAAKYPELSVINPGIDIDLCITQLEELGSNFKRVIICGYPPLLRDLIHHGIQRGIIWSDYNVHIVTAGESMSEAWRQHIQTILGEKSRVVNVYGLADAGVVAAETPTTLEVKKLVKNNLPEFLGGSRTVGLLQYFPDDRYFESDNHRRLILTTNAGLPLIRYDTKDHGFTLSAKEVCKQLKAHDLPIPESLLDTSPPFLCLFGREDFSTTLYAVNIYPENIRPVLDDQQKALLFTGRFVMRTKYRKDMSQYLEVSVELAPGAVISKEFKSDVTKAVITELQRSNTEYRELHAKIGSKARPRLRFKAHNTIGYVAGKKHKWVKHD